MLVDLKPTGPHYMEDLFAARRHRRGAARVETAPASRLPHRHRRDAGRAARPRRRIALSTARWCVRSRERRCSARAGSLRCSARWPPGRHPEARRGRSRLCSSAKARAVVFSLARGPGPAHRRSRTRCRGGRFPGAAECRPRAASGMPEAGYLPIPARLARAGVKDMVRISDARMSGTAYGTVVLHVAPDAASGGPLARVRDRRPDQAQRARAAHRSSLVAPDELARRPAAAPSAPAARLSAPLPRRGAAGRPGLRLRFPAPAANARERRWRELRAGADIVCPAGLCYDFARLQKPFIAAGRLEDGWTEMMKARDLRVSVLIAAVWLLGITMYSMMKGLRRRGGGRHLERVWTAPRHLDGVVGRQPVQA